MIKANRSPKGNMWLAILVALLCMNMNWSERKQGSGPKGDEVLSNTGGICPSIHLSVHLPSVQDALLFKFSLNTMKKWQKAVHGQWYPWTSLICRLNWGNSRPGSGSLRPESGSLRPESESLRPGFRSLRLGFRSLRPEPRSWRSEFGSQRSGSGSLRLGCGF